MATCDKCGKEIEAMCAECQPIQLTPRQQQVLELLVEGLTTREIASQLFMSMSTFKREKRNMYDRFGQSVGGNEALMIAEAFRRGMVK